ncbi:conserved hypothetical protein [Mycoplasmopsis pulmonis]|uniref:Lipoprotein-associated type-17 domain-containing protein n=1 Tax=Mycoplasmopsis pulmonis (strain UAB CTIP) TaxID=272635 RepID=Q98QC9_MYCPU|nr:lipoprotein 17-related variable surface protein [Mycoplasmopsis pulmonis]CAC13610.1 conserved hypothetical protein [Mycoplasmopsis pulmonis]
MKKSDGSSYSLPAKFSLSFDLVDQSKREIDDDNGSLNIVLKLEFENQSLTKIIKLNNLTTKDQSKPIDQESQLDSEIQKISKVELLESSKLKDKLASEILESDLRAENFQLKSNGQNYTLAQGITLSFESPKSSEKQVDDLNGSLRIIVKLTKENEVKTNTFIVSGFKTIDRFLDDELKQISSIELSKNSKLKDKIPSDILNSDLNLENIQIKKVDNLSYSPSPGVSLSLSLSKEKQANDEHGSLKVDLKIEKSGRSKIKTFTLYNLKTKNQLNNSIKSFLEEQINQISKIETSLNKEALPSSFDNQSLASLKAKKQDNLDYLVPSDVSISYDFENKNNREIDDENGILKIKVTLTKSNIKVTKVFDISGFKDIEKLLEEQIQNINLAQLTSNSELKNIFASQVKGENLINSNFQLKKADNSYYSTLNKIQISYRLDEKTKKVNNLEGSLEIIVKLQINQKFKEKNIKVSGFKKIETLEKQRQIWSQNWKSDVIPKPDISKFEGVSEIWEWFKELPKLIKKENPQIIDNKEEFNKILIERYKKFVEFIGDDNPRDIKKNTKLIGEYVNHFFNLYNKKNLSFRDFSSEASRQTNIIGTFDQVSTEKGEYFDYKMFSQIPIAQLFIMKNYAQMRIDILNKMNTQEIYKENGSIHILFIKILDFLNPLRQYFLSYDNKVHPFLDKNIYPYPKHYIKEFYKDLTNLYNKEINFLIDLIIVNTNRFITADSLERIKNNPDYKKYFLPEIDNLEIMNFHDELEKAKSYQSITSSYPDKEFNIAKENKDFFDEWIKQS